MFAVYGRLVMSSMLVLASCKHRAQQDESLLREGRAGSVTSQLMTADGEPVAEVEVDAEEVVDCTPELCPADVEIVTHLPDEENLIAMSEGRGTDEQRGSLALTSGGEAEAMVAFDRALQVLRASDTVFAGLQQSDLAGVSLQVGVAGVAQVLGSDDLRGTRGDAVAAALDEIAASGKSSADEVQSILRQHGVADLTGRTAAGLGLTDSADLARAALKLVAVAKFFNRNIEGNTIQERLKVLAKAVEIGQSFTGNSAASAGAQKSMTIALQYAERFAGEDGYLNHGDMRRILDTFPQMVAAIADRKIQSGLAQGIAQMRSERPFIYRRWVRRPNGLIGRAVNREISRQLSSAYRQKWAAMQEAARTSQSVFNKAMGDIGTRRYYLGSDSEKIYLDPAAPLTVQEMEQVIHGLTGKSVETLARTASANQGQTGGLISLDMRQIMSQVSLPDGLFVREALRLKKLYDARDPLPLPENLSFRLVGGKLEIRQYREMCDCRYEQNSGQCVMTFSTRLDGRTLARYQYAYGPHDDGKSCDSERVCHVNFVMTGRQVFLPYSCAYRYRHEESRQVTVFK